LHTCHYQGLIGLNEESHAFDEQSEVTLNFENPMRYRLCNLAFCKMVMLFKLLSS